MAHRVLSAMISVLALSACRGEEISAPSHAVIVVLPDGADEASERVAALTVETLATMTGATPPLLRGEFSTLESIEAEARRASAALTIVLDGERAADGHHDPVD